MSEPSKTPFDLLVDQIRQAVREEIAAVHSNGHVNSALLTPEELAKQMKVPLSWVYEQSRLGNIPTHRLGKYIRFDFAEVLRSQRDKRPAS